MRELLIWLSLNLIPVAFFPRIEELCNSLDDFYSEENRKELQEILSPTFFDRTLKNTDLNFARETVAKIEEKYNIVTSIDAEYPEKLKYIENYPRVLYYVGDFSLTGGNLLALVGARKCTDYARWAINYLMKDLSDYDFTIVSGLAAGVDALSHRAAIENGLKTIGVLGTGIDIEYPSSNRAIYREMKKNHLVLTEFPPGTKGFPQNFPQRNRIISGLSSATCVIEAKKKSGSLITARLAFEQGREVFAVPGNINSLYSEGANMLIADGAFPLLEARDVLDGVSDYRDMTGKSENKKDVIFTLQEKEVYDIIKLNPCNADEISEKLNKDVSEISAILTLLEIKCLIMELQGNKYTVC